MGLDLKGVIPPVVTPFRNDEVSLADLAENLGLLGRFDLAGYLILGSNGEGVYLSEKEREAVIVAARESIPEEKIMIVGTGCESRRQTIELTNLAAAKGADYALVLNPFYYRGRMTPEVLADHYRAVAEAAEIPVMVYNMPAATGLNMGPQLVADLAEHENIVGLKDSSGNIGQLSEVLRMTDDDFAVFVGNAPVFYPALCLGARGGILAVANTAPQVCLDILALQRAGELDRALDLQRLMTPLAQMVTVGFGIGGLKLAMKLAGYSPGECRAPLAVPEDEPTRETILAELKKLGLA